MAKTRHSARISAASSSSGGAHASGSGSGAAGGGAGAGTGSASGSGSRRSSAGTAANGSGSVSGSGEDGAAAGPARKRRREVVAADTEGEGEGGQQAGPSTGRSSRRIKRSDSTPAGAAGATGAGGAESDSSSSASGSVSVSSSAAVAASMALPLALSHSHARDRSGSASAAQTVAVKPPSSPAPDPSTPLLLSSTSSPEPPSLSPTGGGGRTPKPPPPPPEPVDRLTPLSAELIALIFSFLVVPPPAPPPAPAPPNPTPAPNANPAVPAPPPPAPNPTDPIFYALSPPSPFPLPDRPTLAALCLVSRGLLPHARAALYRKLEVETRVQAHAVHRTLHGSETSRGVREVTANVEGMARTSSQWLGWFLFHSMHSLCGIIGSCRHLLSLTLYLPADSSAWTQSLCQSFVDLKHLQTLTKDLEPSLPSSHFPSAPFSSTYAPIAYRSFTVPADSDDAVGGSGGGARGGGEGRTRKWSDNRGGGAGRSEGMDVGWRPRRSVSMWAVSQFIKPLSTLRSLTTLRLCGISSDSSTLPPPPVHGLKLVEVVLIEVNITNTDLLHLLGDAKSLQRFTLWRSSLLSKRGLTHVLKKCTRLVELKVGGSWFGAKEEDDKTFPLDDALPSLPHLQSLFISGSLISPRALTLPSLNLAHLFVTNSPTWTPKEVHRGLVGMVVHPGGEAGVGRLTLPEMRDPDGGAGRRESVSGSRGSRSHGSGSGAGGGGGGGGSGEQWNETWRFTVKRTGEAKGVRVGDRWKAGRVATRSGGGGGGWAAGGGGGGGWADWNAGGSGGGGVLEEVDEDDEEEDEEEEQD
ncbi:hypothetical protein JCM6882_003466 [Rhodosporidiobolus microsporus]